MGAILTSLALLMPAFALSTAPPSLHSSTSLLTETLPYHAATEDDIRSFGPGLSPGALSARDHSTSELLRTLSRMAASKPTSWLSVRPHILCTLSLDFGTLAGGLGCFPLDHES